MQAQIAPVPGAAPTRNAKLLKWVAEVAALTQPEAIHWCDGSQEEYDALCADAGRGRHVPAPERASAPQLLPRPVRPQRRGPRRGPHLHLQQAQGRRRPDQQLGRARRDARRRCKGLFDGCMRGRTMYVIPFSMGPLGSPISHIGVEITDSPYVVVNMRIMTRMGTARARRARRRRRFRPLPALGRRAARARPEGRRLALQQGPQVHRPLPRGPGDLVLRLAATAATRCSARSASRCASPPSWRATRAGWPSTC